MRAVAPHPATPPASTRLPSLAECILACEQELVSLRAQLREAQLLAIVRVIDGPVDTRALIALLDVHGVDVLQVFGTRDPRKLAKILQRIAGHPVGPYTLLHVKRSARGMQWLVQVALD